MKKIINVFLIATLSGFFNIHAENLSVTISARDIESKSADEIYKVINGLGIRTFSTDKSYIKVGLSEFNLWSQLLVAAGQYLSKQNDIPSVYYNPKNPDSYFFKLRDISAWLNKIIKDLQQGKISGLQVEGILQKQLNDTDNILNVAFTKIVEDSTQGPQFSRWTNTIKKKNINDIFPDLGTFLKKYTSAKSTDIEIAKGFMGYTEPIIYYAYRQAIIDKYEKPGKYQIEKFLEKLRQVIYLEENKWFRRYLSQLKAVFRDINAQFPGTLYPFVIAKFSDTNDKASIIILGIAQALNGALLHFQKDLMPKNPQQSHHIIK